MGCNCTKNGQNVKFRYVSPTGQITYYKTEVEAKAAKIKNKGGHFTKVAS